MEIQLNDKGTAISVPEDADEAAVAAAICATEEAKAAAQAAGKESMFSAFEAFSDMDQATADRIASAYLEGGMESVSEMFFENDWPTDPETAYGNWVSADVKSKLRGLVSSACKALWDECELNLDEDDVLEECAELLKEEACEAMAEADGSGVLDAIPSHALVEMAFVAGNNDEAIDDLHTSHWDVVFSADTAICDASLMRFLKFVNVSPSEFIEACRERGFDPSSPAADGSRSELRQRDAEENALRWRAVLDVEAGRTENVSKLPLSSRYEIAEWNRTVDLVRTCRDHDRPQAVSMDDLTTIMDNATYGGVATWVARLPLREILKGTYDAPFTARGGFVGMHDFLNGSGYIERATTEILIDPSEGAFRKPGSGRWSVDDTYGIVPSYYRAETVPADLDGWRQARPGTWRSFAGDGRMAEITMSKASGGAEEYRLATFDEGGEAAGPWETARILPDLAQAKTEGQEALALEWATAPTP